MRKIFIDFRCSRCSFVSNRERKMAPSRTEFLIFASFEGSGIIWHTRHDISRVQPKKIKKLFERDNPSENMFQGIGEAAITNETSKLWIPRCRLLQAYKLYDRGSNLSTEKRSSDLFGPRARHRNDETAATWLTLTLPYLYLGPFVIRLPRRALPILRKHAVLSRHPNFRPYDSTPRPFLFTGNCK